MNTNVSYGSLPPAMIGGLAVVVSTLLSKANRGEAPVVLKKVPEIIEFSDSGIWGDESLDENVDPRVFRVSDFVGDFRLDYKSAPARSIPQNKLDKFQLRNGDILVVKSSGSAKQVVSGRVAVFETRTDRLYAASNFLIRLRANREIDPNYLAFVLGSPPIREAVADMVKTMTYPNLSFRIYSGLTIPVIPLKDQQVVAGFFRALLNNQVLPELPSYLVEQRRIVTRIEELAAKINEARGLRQQTAETAEALWERGASTVLNTVGLQHAKKRLGDLVTIRGGGTPSKANPYYWDGGIPWVTPKDMKVRGISDSIDHISEHAIQETTAKLIEPGAVLVVVRGMILAHTFPSAVLRVPAAINQDMKALIPNNKILPEFLCAFLWATNAATLYLVEKSTHDTRKLETEKLLAISIPVPPISDQRRIIEELDLMQTRVENLKKLQTETAAELDALLPSILDRAFNRKL